MDNVQSRAHELYGIIIWLCSWLNFLFGRICLGRRFLHNLVGFLFLLFLFSSFLNSVHLSDGTTAHDKMPIAGQNGKTKTHGEERKRKEEIRSSNP